MDKIPLNRELGSPMGPNLDPRTLAQAMRLGLELRLSSEAARPSNLLRSQADLLWGPELPRKGRFRRVIRLLRVLAYLLVRPWLARQTQFNNSLVNALEAIQNEFYNFAVNRELGPCGKLAEAGMWFNPPVAVQLQGDRAVIVNVSERILEEIFVHTKLPPPPARILDLGCAQSLNPIEMASLGFEVVGVDLRKFPLRHALFQMVRTDISNLPFRNQSFDLAVALSTIEHVGLGWCAPEAPDATELKAMAEIKRVLRPGGRLIATVPFGIRATTPEHRIYDLAALRELLEPFKSIEIAFGIREGTSWRFTTQVPSSNQLAASSEVQAVALVVAER